MKLFKILVIGVALTSLCSGYVLAQSDSGSSQKVVYSCDCGPTCKCNSVSDKPGKCACGVQMKAGNVIAEEGGEAVLCQCAKGCGCGVSKDDPTKCACGKDVKRSAMPEKASYSCDCGKACKCNVTSDKPGKCSCGKALKKDG